MLASDAHMHSPRYQGRPGCRAFKGLPGTISGREPAKVICLSALRRAESLGTAGKPTVAANQANQHMRDSPTRHVRFDEVRAPRPHL